jgi:hypothetical protein
MTVSHVAEDAVLGGERVTDGLWTHKGKWQVRGDVVLPLGVIDTSELAANSATQLTGQYFSTPTFSSTSVGAWLATPVSSGSIACSGARVRVVSSGTAYHSVAGASVLLGLMIDGVATYSMLAFYAPGPSYMVPFCFEVYHVPAAGNHTYTLMLNSGGAGTAGLFGNVFHTLYVTEEKR